MRGSQVRTRILWERSSLYWLYLRQALNQEQVRLYLYYCIKYVHFVNLTVNGAKNYNSNSLIFYTSCHTG